MRASEFIVAVAVSQILGRECGNDYSWAAALWEVSRRRRKDGERVAQRPAAPRICVMDCLCCVRLNPLSPGRQTITQSKQTRANEICFLSSGSGKSAPRIKQHHRRVLFADGDQVCASRSPCLHFCVRRAFEWQINKCDKYKRRGSEKFRTLYDMARAVRTNLPEGY